MSEANKIISKQAKRKVNLDTNGFHHVEAVWKSLSFCKFKKCPEKLRIRTQCWGQRWSSAVEHPIETLKSPGLTPSGTHSTTRTPRWHSSHRVKEFILFLDGLQGPAQYKDPMKESRNNIPWLACKGRSHIWESLVPQLLQRSYTHVWAWRQDTAPLLVVPNRPLPPRWLQILHTLRSFSKSIWKSECEIRTHMCYE